MKLINKKIGDLDVQIDAGSEVLSFQSQFNGRVLFVGPPARTGIKAAALRWCRVAVSWRFLVLELVMVTCFVASASCF
jgi:hypothetical protein